MCISRCLFVGVLAAGAFFLFGSLPPPAPKFLSQSGAFAADAAGITSWTTYRGGEQRTASDGKPGPAKPNILWSMQAKEHYVASPVPAGDRLFVSGLGAFNVASFQCLSTDPKAAKRLLWNKSTPGLKLPTVSAPAIVDGRVIFGDGMHQTDGATLHCLGFDKGMRIWQYRTPPPDRLVHLEGSPTVSGNLAYIGGGNLGVICVDIDKVSLEGKVLPPKEIQKILDEKWAVLQKKYEDEKKKDPDFAIPPTEDDLPKATPALAWQRGQNKWHVDSPVNLVGDKLLVATAFLEKEMVGDKALYCLDAKTGDEKWRVPLKLNPWGGASVLGKTVVITGSSIGYYPGQLKGAKGDITALDLESGKQIWSKEMPGGAVSCAVLADGMAICTATDGKVRAFDLATGERKWIYESKMPYFAPPAYSDGVVYAGDLNGGIHAIDAKTGAPKWTLDLGAAPLSLPGSVYGGPIVYGGRVYVNTCNLEGIHANKPTVVVCIGEK
jgi:outer membrane protein assembly factor BamB